MLKKYDQFINENYKPTVDMEFINNRLNDPVYIGKIKYVYNLLSDRNKSKLKEFLSGPIDIDKIEKYIKKYNLFSRAKSLFNKGVKDPNKVIDELESKNESLSGILIAIIVLISISILAKSSLIKILILVLAIIAISISPGEEIKEVYLIKDNKKYNIELTETTDGIYRATIIDEDTLLPEIGDFSMRSMTPEEIQRDYPIQN